LELGRQEKDWLVEVSKLVVWVVRVGLLGFELGVLLVGEVG
jgi:hypothetical protein